ncbi:TIGR02530 family flagellar biosynthesis protein [Bacillus horti]|uniref:Flagellar operon protein n=1 Tax=Caldalkalibacillus horti TaxID=77523 RepID=A0ABT9VUK0_9BACI|nr:TIGR02530 family flagellar biosynthesis protein [Bacillus horti]MDQ0164668.1 flagellar operon protein [Bacillus horti]
MKAIKAGHSYQINAHPIHKPLQQQKVNKGQFKTAFELQLQQTLIHSDVKFSQHARTRMEERGIEMNQDLIQKINQGVSKAQTKGAKESLFLIDNHAFVVSVKNQTVITAMERDELQDQMVTNIDSAVLL